MNTPPEPADSRGALSFRPAVASDDAFLFNLFRDARADEFAPLGWDGGRLDALLQAQFDAQRRDYAANYPTSERRIVIRNGRPVGLLWLDFREAEIRLLDFIVARKNRNVGIGAACLRALQAEAAASGLPLRHMVAVGNPRAQRLYERSGFTVVSEAGSHRLMEWPPPDAETTPSPG